MTATGDAHVTRALDFAPGRLSTRRRARVSGHVLARPASRPLVSAIPRWTRRSSPRPSTRFPLTTTTTTTARLRRRLRLRPQLPCLPRAFPGVDPHPADGDAAREASLSIVSSLTLPRTRPSVRRRGVAARGVVRLLARVSRPRPFRRPVHRLRVGVHAWGPEAPPPGPPPPRPRRVRRFPAHRPSSRREAIASSPPARGHGDSQWSASSAYSPSAPPTPSLSSSSSTSASAPSSSSIRRAPPPPSSSPRAIPRSSPPSRWWRPPDAPADAWTYRSRLTSSAKRAAAGACAPEIEEDAFRRKPCSPRRGGRLRPRATPRARFE